jgi:hypothetical protein
MMSGIMSKHSAGWPNRVIRMHAIADQETVIPDVVYERRP